MYVCHRGDLTASEVVILHFMYACQRGDLTASEVVILSLYAEPSVTRHKIRLLLHHPLPSIRNVMLSLKYASRICGYIYII